MLQSWLASVAAVSVRGKNIPNSADGDADRRRKNSANRIAGTLIAALNLAYRAGRVSSDKAWRHLRRFEGVDAARTRYLTVAESVRLLNACPEDFRQLVRAALETGCRFGELARLVVSDFNSDVGAIAVRRSKTGRGRHVILTAEGSEFFAAITAGRSSDELMLKRADGEPWRHSNQARPTAAAVARAKIAPRISFHGLRHSYASLSIMAGVPLMVVARNLGHADTRMVERHYGHLAEDYVAAEIRRGAPRFGAEPSGNVESLDRAKARAGR
jgi:integrase